jgi:hypothetical protein
MVLRPFLLALLTFSMLGSALAQSTPPKPGSTKPGSTKKLYKWVGADGRVFYSDQVPPEDISRAREEKSVTTGRTVDTVDRAMSAEERAALDLAKKQQADKDAAAAAEDLRLQGLLGSYATEEALLSSFAARQAALQDSVKISRSSLANQRAALVIQLQRLGDQELENSKISPKATQNVMELHRQVRDLARLVEQNDQDQAALKAEQASLLAAFRARRAASAIPPAPPVPGAK